MSSKVQYKGRMKFKSSALLRPMVALVTAEVRLDKAQRRLDAKIDSLIEAREDELGTVQIVMVQA